MNELTKIVSKLENSGEFILADKVANIVIPILAEIDKSAIISSNSRRAAFHFKTLARRLQKNKVAGSIRDPEYESVGVEFVGAYDDKNPMRNKMLISIDVGQFMKRSQSKQVALRRRWKASVGKDELLGSELYQLILKSNGFTPTKSQYGSFVKKIPRRDIFLYLVDYPKKGIVLGIVLISAKIEDIRRKLPKEFKPGIGKDKAEILISKAVIKILSSMP